MDYLSKALKLNQQAGRLDVELRWEKRSGTNVDLDVSAVCFSDKGALVDAAYYNQLVAAKGAIVHSGDCRRGGAEGCDEKIALILERLNGISVVVFLVSAFSTGSLGSCDREICTVSFDKKELARVESSSVSTGSAQSLIMCMLFRHPDTAEWHFVEVKKPVAGRHFSACLVGIRHEVDTVIDPSGFFERHFTDDKTFQMGKGDLLEVPLTIQRLYVGLGWTAREEGVDLDASCIMLTRNGEGMLTPVDIAYFQDQVRPGVQHLGDNTTGEGEGDDERIFIDLSAVEAHVAALAIVVTIYNNKRSFADILDSYVRLMDASTGHVYARFDLTESLTKSGVIFCLLTRGETSRDPWTLQTVGAEVAAKTARMMRSDLWDSYYAAPGQRTTHTDALPMVDPLAPAPFEAVPKAAPATSAPTRAPAPIPVPSPAPASPAAPAPQPAPQPGPVHAPPANAFSVVDMAANLSEIPDPNDGCMLPPKDLPANIFEQMAAAAAAQKKKDSKTNPNYVEKI